jgi:signal peptidase I
MNKYLKLIVWVIGVGAVAAGIGWFFFGTETVPDNSMAPTLWAGDKVLVLERGEIDRGDIAVCEHPDFPGEVVMGRVVGMPGDTVSIQRSQLSINGEIMHEEAEGPFVYWDRRSSAEAFELTLLKKKVIIGGTIAYLLYDREPRMGNFPKTTIEDGYFLLGDNRVHGAAIDSRDYGEVHESLCRGKAFFVYSAVKGIGDADEERRQFTFLVD